MANTNQDSTAGSVIKVNLTGAHATLMMVLFQRAVDARTASPVLGDPYAQKTIDRVSFPLGEHYFNRRSLQLSTQITALRSVVFDQMIGEFLSKHDDATVLQLACGLDSRAVRMDWHRPGVRWIDVDVPDVVAIRRQMPHLKPAAPADYTLLAAWAGRDDGWLDTVPNDRPTLIVAEGLMMYLPRAEANHLIARLVTRFGGRDAAARAGQNLFLFDAIGPLLAFMVRVLLWLRPMPKDLQFRWGWTLASADDVAALHPGIRGAESIGRFATDAVRRLTWPWRLFARLGRLASPRDTVDILRVRF